jgi:catechol 2,3-dioxygenase-like lactoylglutathione lyase family enzyme
MMNYKLDHIALNCKVLSESISYYEKYFGGKPSAIRTAGDGHNFGFIIISGAAAIQLIESQTESGINHFGFVADDMNEVVTELAQRMPKFCARCATPIAD